MIIGFIEINRMACVITFGVISVVQASKVYLQKPGLFSTSIELEK
jgi:hypothetical protein